VWCMCFPGLSTHALILDSFYPCYRKLQTDFQSYQAKSIGGSVHFQMPQQNVDQHEKTTTLKFRKVICQIMEMYVNTV